jgi:hypothetical protein
MKIKCLLCVFSFQTLVFTKKEFPISTNGVIISEVIEIYNIKNKLYANAKDWVARTFGDYKR